MKTTETVKQELVQIFGENVGGNVIEQDGIINSKINVEGDITDSQLDNLKDVGRFKLKRSGAGITIEIATTKNYDATPSFV